jgi:hypothetical protein
MPELTKELRELARQEALIPEKAVNGEKANPQNLYTLLIFFNPAVGALPQHAHLFAEHGCFDSRTEGKTKTRECTEQGNEEKMPQEFYPLPLLDENQKKWEDHIRSKILNKNNTR